MIYTSYEMIQDCRAGKPAGWSYFLTNYRSVTERLAAHYGVADVEAILAKVRSALLPSMQPVAERYFVAGLRQAVVAQLPDAPLDLDLEVMSQAFGPLTVVEKKAVWLETMRYAPDETGRMLRMDPQTVGKIRDKASELLRAGQDRWSRTMLADNGVALGRAVTAQRQAECVPAKALLDMIDGRSTWSKREEAERHIINCWHCVDAFSRMHEVCDIMRGK
jgi:hypothetical protein